MIAIQLYSTCLYIVYYSVFLITGTFENTISLQFKLDQSRYYLIT